MGGLQDARGEHTPDDPLGWELQSRRHSKTGVDRCEGKVMSCMAGTMEGLALIVHKRHLKLQTRMLRARRECLHVELLLAAYAVTPAALRSAKLCNLVQK